MLTTSIIHLPEHVDQIGNAYMDGDTDLWGIVDSAWHHAIISDNLYSDFKKNCDFSLVELSPECGAAIGQLNALYNIIDIYSLYTDRCELGHPAFNTSSSAQNGRTSSGRVSALNFSISMSCSCSPFFSFSFFFIFVSV